MRIGRDQLLHLYLAEKKSLQAIANDLSCSPNTVVYWMNRYRIPRRTISEAVYVLNNPLGDPFKMTRPKSLDDAKLFGMGIGLYWGEGTKANKSAVRLGNTDPLLIKTFIEFLVRCFSIDPLDLRYSLQVFSDSDPARALAFWREKLKAERHQFYKTTISAPLGKGTYRKKSRNGVLTVYYHNKKLRDLLVSLLPE